MENPENAIEVRNVRKTFGTHKSMSIKDRAVYHSKKKPKSGREVLRDISFDVKKGEALAIIGRNGSGKSTILKLLTKIIRPNEGSVETQGRVSCLIELGAGFHPDMSGRENIYINASIFGLDRDEVDQRMRSILDFSEIEPYIDERVRDYSSGMYMRLAFSIAININADILIVDEILSVGDIAYQHKCLEKIRELKKSGVTIVLVTQSPDQARSLCDRTIWLDNGDMRMIGDTKSVCRAYESYMLGKFNAMPSGEAIPLEKTNPVDKVSVAKLSCPQIDDPEVGLISFDVFGTLLIRPCISSIDILRLIGVKDYGSRELRLMRWYSDDRAYDKCRARETIDDIYDAMTTYFNLDLEVADRLKVAELEAEAEYIRPNLPVKALFDRAVASGKKVVLITDTYFTEEFLRNILKRNGIEGYDKLYISNSTGRRKEEGDLFDYMIADSGFKPESILHIGIRYRSDCVVPRSRNMKTLHLMSPVDWFKESEIGGYIDCLNDSFDNGVLWGIYCNLFTKTNGYSAEVFSSPYNFGTFLGPMVLELVQWLILSNKSAGIKRLLFCYPGGYIVKQILDMFSKYSDLGFEYDDTWLSGALMLPFFSVDRGLLASLAEVKPSDGMKLEDFIRFRLYVNDEDSYMESLKILASAGYVNDQSPIGPLTSILPAIKGLDPIFKKSSKRIAENVHSYCDHIIKDELTAVFDVGFNGDVPSFIQNYVGKDILGYQMFVGLGMGGNKRQLNSKCYYDCSYRRDEVSELIALLFDSILSVQGPNVVDVFMEDGVPRCVFNGDAHPCNVTEEIQRGILGYAEYALEVLKGKFVDLSFDYSFEYTILADMMSNPNPNFMKIIKEIEVRSHQMIAGSVQNDSLKRWYSKYKGDVKQ